MSSNPFYLVDVFAERRYTGNQLVVVVDAADLAVEEMGEIAAEMDYSETAFVESLDPTDGGYDVRIFTPEEELPFAGHPAIGTAAVLRELTGEEDVRLNLDAGQVPVRVEAVAGRETLWLSQPSPSFGERFAHEAVADVLSLDGSDLDHGWPVQAVSTGLWTAVVPVRDRDALSRVSVDRQAFADLFDDTVVRNVTAFCPEPGNDENDLAVRVMAPYMGDPPEDAATGSANGSFAAYLASHGYVDGGDVDVRVEQGEWLGRPSLLFLRASADGETASDIEVSVGGRVVPVAEGSIY